MQENETVYERAKRIYGFAEGCLARPYFKGRMLRKKMRRVVRAWDDEPALSGRTTQLENWLKKNTAALS